MLCQQKGRLELCVLRETIVVQPWPRSALIWLRNPTSRGGWLPAWPDTSSSSPRHLRRRPRRSVRDAPAGTARPARGTAAGRPDAGLFQSWLATTAGLLPRHRPAARVVRPLAPSAPDARAVRARSPQAWHRADRPAADHRRSSSFTSRPSGSPPRSLGRSTWTPGSPTVRAPSTPPGPSWSGPSEHATCLPCANGTHRSAKNTSVLSQDERLALRRRFLTTDDEPVAYRLAAVVLLYAQPATRLARLRLRPGRNGQHRHAAARRGTQCPSRAGLHAAPAPGQQTGRQHGSERRLDVADSSGRRST